VGLASTQLGKNAFMQWALASIQLGKHEIIQGLASIEFGKYTVTQWLGFHQAW
jgi:hypothetical protein